MNAVGTLIAIAALASCAQGAPPGEPPDSRAGGGDDAARPGDAALTVAAAPLLLSEVVVQPTAAEMVEVINPTAATVALDRYYLADVPTYYRFPAGTQTIAASDFIARFPAGAVLPSGGIATVALGSAASFTEAFGVMPTYSLGDGTMVLAAQNGPPTLTNAGELVALFYWDGAADLVTDVDLMVVAAPGSANGLGDKSSISIDGPDADGVGTAYAPDTNSLPDQPGTIGLGQSTKRVAFEDDHEMHGGSGNGVDGDDETSEDTGITWSSAYSAATPGVTTLSLP